MRLTQRLIPVFAILIGLSTPLIGQNTLSPKANEFAQQKGHHKGKFLIYGRQHLNWDSLRLVWDGSQIPAKERAPHILRELNQRYDHFLQSIEAQNLQFEVLDHLVGLNALHIKASKETLNALSQNPSVAYIEFDNEQVLTPHLPVPGNQSTTRALNGTEPGLLQVKADKLWAMGYTGKGKKMLSVDTGIWPNHPSLGSRFLGNRVPLDHAWMKYDQMLPGDKRNSHGTHTAATVLGLDTSTNDTVGVAFNAQFMAGDPIVSSASDIRPMYEIAEIYMWAMNPDRDTNTTHDIPDVINNSWGHTFDPVNDSAVCAGYWKDLLIAIEAAGIVNIQSAGNNGPGGGTVGSPATGMASLVNNFAVGAVNFNSNIASFSSRGPGVCDGTGALKIKPEVVAPGVNVRSAIRRDDGSYDYDNYQGTSMAGPHVSGVALLLMEAFPQASAKEIKESMYYSAIDLGTPGEDNTYGRGLIDAEASFNYLDSIYTAIPPSGSPMDLNIIGTSLDNRSFTCQRTFTPVLYFNNPTVTNKGSVEIHYGFVGQPLRIMNLGTGTLQPQDSVVLDTISASKGFQEFYALAMYTGGMAEDSYDNNSWVSRFHIAAQSSLPIAQDFENENLLRSDWYLENPDLTYGWDTISATTMNGTNHTARMRMARYTYRESQEDEMTSPRFTPPETGDLWLAYDLSYQFKVFVFNDSLKIRVSEDCGDSWVEVLATGQDSINTTDKAIMNEWEPQDADDWRRDTIDLSAFVGKGELMVQFQTINKGGNNLYIDNIDIWTNTPSFISEKTEKSNWTLYPNPVQDGNLFIDINSSEAYTIYSVDGRQVLRGRTDGNIDVSSLKQGVYIISLNGKSDSKRFVVK